MNKLLVALVLAFGSLSVIATAQAVQRTPGDCGEYMYWKDGKCVDARNKSSSGWTDTMSSKKAQW
jgi:hypothetical protein